MPRRPLSITIISWIFIAVGCVGLVYHLSPRHIGELQPRAFPYKLIGVSAVRMLAIVAGVFMWRGANWARWLAVIWLAYHVVLSAFHSISQLAMHGVLLAVITYFLFRPRASAFFRQHRTLSGEQVR
jgi:hypothetical protein